MSLLLTIELMMVAVAIATVVGVVGAWAAATASQTRSKTGRWIARLFFVAMVVCLALPLILHAAAWEATAGKFGWLSLTQVGSASAGGGRYGGLGGVFGGLVACGLIHGIFGSSLVALATWYGTNIVPTAVAEQSRLEFGPFGSWWRVRLPLAMPWVATAMLATAALAATEMTVVDLYGYRTLADRFYLQYVVDPSTAAIFKTIAIPMLLAGAIMYLLFSRIDRTSSIQSSTETRLTDDTSTNDKVSPIVRLVAYGLLIAISALVALIPMLGLVVKAGHEVVVVGSDRMVSWSANQFLYNVLTAPSVFAAEYRWTMILAVMTGGVAVALGWALAVCCRTRQVMRLAVDLTTIAMVLIPGPIVGLAVVRLFQLDIPGFRNLYHQTLVPTVIGLLVRALPVSYWIMRAGYRGVGNQVIDSASLEMTYWRRLWCIDRPMLARSLAAAFLASAVIASGDVPVMLPVIPPGVSTVGTRLFEQLHSGARYQEASLAFWYVCGIALLVLVSRRWQSKSHGRMV